MVDRTPINEQVCSTSLGGDHRSAGYVDESRDLGHSLSTEAEPTAQESPDSGHLSEPRLPMSAPEVALQLETPDVIVRAMLTPDRAIDDFLGDCRARGWSERSISSYTATLYRFADRLADDLDVSKITVDDLRRYRASRQKKVARNTLAIEEAHLASWLRWLFHNRKITANPIDRLDRTKRTAAEDLDVTTIGPEDVGKLLAAAKPGAELNAIAILAYLGPRRHAVAALKLSDYRREDGPPSRIGEPEVLPEELLAVAEELGIDLTVRLDPLPKRKGASIRFHEKGAKTIWKPVPDELAAILDASISRGDIRPAPEDYLIPPEGFLQRKDNRDDRVIWRVVKKVADRAGVESHVHALRAAFAVFYLDQYPDDILGLKDLLGHKSLNTTLLYLRRRNRQAGMERVRTLSWAGNSDTDLSTRNHEEWNPTTLVTSRLVGAGGFEPPHEVSLVPDRAGSEQPTTKPAAVTAAAPTPHKEKAQSDA